jgi:hypothetical protein
MIRNNLRVPGSIRASRVVFGALAESRFFRAVRDFLPGIRSQTPDILFKNKDDQFRTSAADRPNA